MKTLGILAVVILSLAVSTQATAAGFKCGFNKIVRVGDNKAKVRTECGEPVYKDNVAGEGSDIQKEAWTYQDYADSKWMTTLHFRDGKLTKIESLGKVQ